MISAARFELTNPLFFLSLPSSSSSSLSSSSQLFPPVVGNGAYPPLLLVVALTLVSNVDGLGLGSQLKDVASVAVTVDLGNWYSEDKDGMRSVEGSTGQEDAVASVLVAPMGVEVALKDLVDGVLVLLRRVDDFVEDFVEDLVDNIVLLRRVLKLRVEDLVLLLRRLVFDDADVTPVLEADDGVVECTLENKLKLGRVNELGVGSGTLSDAGMLLLADEDKSGVTSELDDDGVDMVVGRISDDELEKMEGRIGVKVEVVEFVRSIGVVAVTAGVDGIDVVPVPHVELAKLELLPYGADS